MEESYIIYLLASLSLSLSLSPGFPDFSKHEPGSLENRNV